MAQRTLPGPLGLTGFWILGYDGWKDENDANLRKLSAMTIPVAKSRVTSLPGSPTDGDIYIVPSGAGSNPNEIAIRDNGAWVYLVPGEGWDMYVLDEDQKVRFDGAAWGTIPGSANSRIRNLEYVFDGAGSVLTTGIKGDLTVDFSGQIQSWTLLADQTGSIQFDIWKDTYANYPPTIADTITASAKPLLSSATKNTNSTLTGWTKTVNAGDIFRFNIDSVATITRAVLSLQIKAD